MPPAAPAVLDTGSPLFPTRILLDLSSPPREPTPWLKVEGAVLLVPSFPLAGGILPGIPSPIPTLSDNARVNDCGGLALPYDSVRENDSVKLLV